MKKTQIFISIALIIASIVIAIIFVEVASERTLTQLEVVFFQAFSLFLGLLGSYMFGRQSAIDAAREIIKPHARSAFRRVLSLFNSLSRLASIIENARPTYSKSMRDNLVLDKLEAIVTEQIATADDALEDWKDIIPDDVEVIRKKVRETDKKGVNND